MRKSVSAEVGVGREQATAPVKTPSRSLVSSHSLFNIGCVLSVLSLFSAGSILSIGSVGSILSVGSTGSILSIGSTGSILSIGSAGSLLSRSRRRV